MLIPPYIGITDFTNSGQVSEMLEVFYKNLREDSERLLHVGVMMNYETLRGRETKWKKTYPKKEEIASIFSFEETYNCLHYVDRDPKGHGELPMAICDAISYGGMYLDALQLDMVWPDPGEVAHGVHTSRKMLEVILQIGTETLREVDDDPIFLVDKLQDYKDVVQRVLLDKSMGRGVPMNAEELLPFIRAIRENFPEMGIGVAGGLGPETVHLVEPLLKEFPDLSFDAQGKLRPSGNALDPVDWNMAGIYLAKGLILTK